MSAPRVMVLRLIALLTLPIAACAVQQTLPATPLPTSPPRPSETSTSEPTPASPTTATPTVTPVPSDLVWFGPNMGSRDYSELFAKPEQWSVARSRIDVFKFHVQNVLPYPCAICGSNTLDTFVQQQAFRKLGEWGIPIAVDVGAVKEWGCTGSDGYRVVKEIVRNIAANGGKVAFLVMDEPYMGGELVANGKTCGFTMAQSADATAKFMGLVDAAYPNIILGETEPYPYFSVSELETWIGALQARGTVPEFFHLDVNMVEGGRRLNARRVASDLQRLSRFFQEQKIPFGVIFTANTKWDAGSDLAYFDSTMEWIRLVNDAIGRPQQVIFNSWLGSTTDGISNRLGVHELPINLPEDDPSVYSHTRLILEGLDLLEP